MKLPTDRISLLVVVSLAMVMVAGSAHAAVISFEDSHASSLTDWNDILTVSQFDPSQGFLNSVKITFEANILSDMTLDNDNATAVTVVGETNVSILGSFVGLGSLAVSPSGTTGPQNLGPDDSGDTDNPGDGGPDEMAFPGLMGTEMLMVTLTPGDADFASFIGLGDLSTIGLQTLGGFSVQGGGGNVDVNVNTQAGAVLNVMYDFDVDEVPEVPEPSSALLVGLGMLAYGWRRRHQ